MHIPITKPYLSDREYELVKESLDSGWLVQGPKVEEFEKKIAESQSREDRIKMEYDKLARKRGHDDRGET